MYNLVGEGLPSMLEVLEAQHRKQHKTNKQANKLTKNDLLVLPLLCAAQKGPTGVTCLWPLS